MKKYTVRQFFSKSLKILLIIIGLWSLLLVFYNIFAPAKISYDPLLRVSYNDKTYIETDWDFKTYHLIYDDSYEKDEKKMYIKDCFIPFRYVETLCEKFDKTTNFIYIPHLDQVCVKENFVYPTLENNEIDEVWMSHSSSYEIIKDKENIEKIVECAKSEGKIFLDKEIVDYIKRYSSDNHCFWVKYEGYPLVEEFHIKETEDGRYIIEQYTQEEYDTIYWEDEAHK